ncbi:MAG TPA: hypothetical protein VHT73_05070 [Thermodesulfobacteriota bacterium]|nr:hypothetical protein [Thermodesulfobacteriota bacterium]
MKNGLSQKLETLERKAKPVTYPDIVVVRRVIDKRDGRLCVISELNRMTGEYTEFNPPILINREELK